jgi:F0F1-type ATP synthase assembly protein I
LTGAPQPGSSKGRKVYQGARMSAVGLEMGVSVLLGYGAGWWVDGKIDSAPWGGVIGISMGFAAGVRSMWRLAKQIDRESAAEEAAEAGPRGPRTPLDPSPRPPDAEEDPK